MANGGNINNAASAGMQQAGTTSAAGTTYQAPTLAATNMQQYQNPYQQQVIDNSISDLDKSRQMTMNNIGASATSAGAFGGSRHGLVEAENNANFMEQAGNLSASLNQAGYNNAQNAAQFDINNNMASQGLNLGAANQLAGQAGQAFDIGQTLNNNLASDGLQQQAVMQQLIDAAQAQYGGFTSAPTNALNLPLAALGATPNVSSQTTSTNPGLLNYLSLGMGLI